MEEEKFAMEKAFELDKDDRTLASLCYGGTIIPLLGLVIPAYVLLSEQKNKPPLRLHAIQSLTSQVAYYVIFPVVSVAVWTIVHHIPCIGSLIGSGIVGLLALGYLGINLFWAFKTFQGETFTIPFITDFVTKQFKKE
jgi:uncharacterized membrane protein